MRFKSLILDKATGEPLWQSKEIKKQGAIFLARAGHDRRHEAVRADDDGVGLRRLGEGWALLWRADFPGKTAVIPTPVVKDNLVFVTAGYGVGDKLIEIKPGNEVAEVYASRTMKNHHGGVLLFGENLYGYSDGIGWLCMNFKSGEQV